MTALVKSFGFDEQLVRVVERDDDYWFVANDVCAALELANPRDVVARLDDDERDCVGLTDAIGRERETTVISEGGMYTIVLRSRDAMKVGTVAYRFRKWVTGEVLPTLRRTGKFEMPANDLPPMMPTPYLGTADDVSQIRTAVLLVRECKDLYGQQAGRQMWQKLGFPVPDDLPAAAMPGPMAQSEGDLHAWAMAAGVDPSRRVATSVSDLFASYSRWCGRHGHSVMTAGRFRQAMVTLFGTEEHPDMIRVVMKKG